MRSSIESILREMWCTPSSSMYFKPDKLNLRFILMKLSACY